MKGFFKTILMGLIYIVTLPLVLLVLALYALYLLVIFCFMGIKCVIVFFKGGTPLGDLPEDVEAKRILMQKEEQQQAMAAAATAMYQQQQAYYQQQMQQQDAAGLNRPVFNPGTDQQVPQNQFPQQQNTSQEQPSQDNFEMENYFNGETNLDNNEGGNDNGTY